MTSCTSCRGRSARRSPPMGSRLSPLTDLSRAHCSIRCSIRIGSNPDSVSPTSEGVFANGADLELDGGSNEDGGHDNFSPRSPRSVAVGGVRSSLRIMHRVNTCYWIHDVKTPATP